MYFCVPFLRIPKPNRCVVPADLLQPLPPNAGAGLTRGPSPLSLLSRQPGPAGTKPFPISGAQFAGRAVCATSPSQLPSYCAGERALTPAPSTERPGQGETLPAPPRWAHALYRQCWAPGGMPRPPHTFTPPWGASIPATQANTRQLPRDRQRQALPRSYSPALGFCL